MSTRKRKRKLKKRPFIILLLIILFFIFGIYLFTHTNKYLFLKGLDNTYNNIVDIQSSFLNNYLPYTNDNYYSNIDSTIKVLTSDIDTSFSFLGDIYLNADDIYYNLKIDADKMKNQLEMLSQNDKLYYKIDDFKYYYLDYSYNNTSIDDYSKLLYFFTKSLKKSISEKNLESTNEKIIINANTYKTKKMTLHLTDELYKKIMKSFYSEIKDDERLLNLLLSFTNYTSILELVSYFEGNSLSLSDFIGDDSLDYSIYLYKAHTIKNMLSYTKDDVECNLAFIIYDDYLEISSQEGDSSSYLKFINDSIEVFIDGIGYGTGSYASSFFKINFVDYDNTSLGSVDYAITKDTDEYQSTLTVRLDLSEINVYLFIAKSIKVDKDIPEIDVSGSEPIEDMPDDEISVLNEILSRMKDIFTF